MSKCYYINNGVDLSSFQVKANGVNFKDEQLDSDKFKVIYCGTIRPINNVEILVDVAKIVGDKVQILIYGTGNCEEKIRDRIEKEGVSNLFLKGYIENSKVPYVLSKSSLNILNYSKNDYNWSRGNSSNKLFEYFASGKPVLSTVKMGYDLLEKYGCGVSDEIGTPESISEKILGILNLSKEEYQKMCDNAKKAAEDFDIKNLAREYLGVIEKTIDRHYRR
jgi:glycosyltransferase involved in cell wall biosynthesis